MKKINSILRFQTLAHLLVLRPIVKLAFDANTVGGSHFQGLSNYIIIANHNSHLDTLLLFHILPPHKIASTHVVAALDYFIRPKWLFLLVKCLFKPLWVDRKTSGISSLKKLQAMLDKGHSIILYPEGTRGADDKLLGFQKGIGKLARDNPNVPVVPIYLKGPEKVLPKGTTVPLPLQNFITVFPPQYLEGEIDDITENLFEQFMAHIDAERLDYQQKKRPLKTPDYVAVIGIDGCGKSTLSKSLATKHPGESCFIGDSLLFYCDGNLCPMQPLITDKLRTWVGKKAKKAEKLALYKVPKITELLLRDHLLLEIGRWYRPNFIFMDGSPLLNIAAWSIIYHEDSFNQKTCSLALDILSGKITPRLGDPLYKEFRELFFLCKMQLNQLHMPLGVIFLDITPETCIQRIQARGQRVQAHENIDKLSKLRKAYQLVIDELKSSGHNVCVIEGDDLKPDRVSSIATRYVHNLAKANEEN